MTIIGADPVLAVADLDVSATWYERVFGCERHDVAPGQWTFCVAGATTFRLGRCPDAPPLAEVGDHSYLAFLRVEDVDAVHDAAVRAGADVLHPPRDEPWGWREMAIRSPDGHRFMVATRVR
jgi:uncharacterized glyoxalase superfamily protein PhnB